MLQESFVDVRNLRHTLATRLLKQMRGREPNDGNFELNFDIQQGLMTAKLI